MKKYDHLREKAVLLRNNGISLTKICKMLNKSKGTVYEWIKNIEVKIHPDYTEMRERASIAMRKKYKTLRDAAYSEGQCIYQQRKNDVSFRDFILIYLTEGFRKTQNSVQVANSNSNIIKVSQHIIKQFTTKKIDYCVQYHIDQNIDVLRKFWSDELKINSSEIKFILKSNSGKMKGRNWNCVNGVMTIRTHDTYFRAKIQAWMDLVESEWQSLDN